MTGYLKRLVSSLAAYQVADLVSKFIAVLLLPVYTRYINPAGYGVVELLGNGVILISILVRFGMIESFLRFYFSDEDQRAPGRAGPARGRLPAVTTTIASVVLAVFAAPLSKIVLGYRDPTIFRIAVLGLWAFTNLELAYALLARRRAPAHVRDRLADQRRADDRLLGRAGGRARAGCASGLLLGNYGASTVVLLGAVVDDARRLLPRRHAGGRDAWRAAALRPADRARRGVGVRAQHRRPLLHLHHEPTSPTQAGLYSIAVKLAGAVAFIVRAFQYAWPPLAYSVSDDAEAARLYGLVTTYYLLVSGLVVAGLALLGRWVLRLLAAPGVLRGLPRRCRGWRSAGRCTGCGWCSS